MTCLGATVNIGVEVGDASISILQPIGTETVMHSVGEDVQVTWDRHPPMTFRDPA